MHLKKKFKPKYTHLGQGFICRYVSGNGVLNFKMRKIYNSEIKALNEGPELHEAHRGYSLFALAILAGRFGHTGLQFFFGRRNSAL